MTSNYDPYGGSAKARQPITYGDGSRGSFDPNNGTYYDSGGHPINPDSLGVAPKTQDSSPNVGLNPATGQYEYFVYGSDGKPQFNGVQAPPVNMTPGHSTSNNTSNSTSTSTSVSTNATKQVVQRPDGSTWVFDPVAGTMTQLAPPGGMSAYEAAQLQNSYDIAAGNNRTSKENTQASEAGANARNAATVAGSAANTQTTEAGANSRNAASIAGNANDRAAQNAFGAWQQDNQQGFTANQNALSAAQRAGEFAATYTIQKAQQETADRNAKIQAAKTFSDLSGAADLTGYDRFLAAGGGDAGAAISRGGSSLTNRGQLGAARALDASRAPLPVYGEAPSVPAVTPWTATPWGGYGAGAGSATTTTTSPVRSAGGAPRTDASGAALDAGYTNNFGKRADGSWGVTGVTKNAPVAVANAADGSEGFAFGTGGPPIRRGQLGRSSTTSMPNGGSMDSVTDRYALGTRRNLLGHPAPQTQYDPNAGIPEGFANGTDNAIPTGQNFDAIVGDSTAQDPAAGGAHPEALNINDPTGDATVDIDPMTQPGVGDTSGMEAPTGGNAEMLGALLVAIGNFLTQQPAAPEPSTEPRFALGTMGRPRYALGSDPTTLDGTGATEADQASINEVMGMRTGTPYSVNPFEASYLQSDPTKRKIDAAAFQTATGVPEEELGYVANRYQPGGMARSSTYARDHQLGV